MTTANPERDMTLKTILLILLPGLLLSQSLSIEHIRIRDPFILADQASETYYLYAQMGNRRDARENEKGVEVYTSKDLESWSGPEPVFHIPNNFWADAMVWAPEVREYNSRYYLFVTFTSRDTLPAIPGRPKQIKRGTQILVADSPMGPFKPFHNRAHTPAQWMALDGTLWVEGERPYMIFCHEWVQIADGTIELAPLTPDLSDLAGPPKTLFKASDAGWVKSISHNSIKDYVTDGPFLYRSKSDKLLMIWSSFGKKGYAIGVAESVSGTISGPWKQQPDLLFAENGGHGMIFKTFDGTLMLVFHQPNKSPLERAQLFELEDLGERLRLKR